MVRTRIEKDNPERDFSDEFKKLLSNDDLLADTNLAAWFLSCSPRTLTTWRARGQGPKYININGGRLVRYRMEDLRNFVDSWKSEGEK
jgi:hypothetical protein